MQLILCFIGNKCINRFACFLSAVVNHKGDAMGVIINFNETNIQIIYSHEKTWVDNYMLYKREANNYFEFTYFLQENFTYTEKVFADFPYQDNGILYHTFRMDIENFTTMQNFISSNSRKYENFFLRAKTLKENPKSVNVFRLRIEAPGNYITQDFKLIGCRHYYKVSPPTPCESKFCLSIKFQALKEVAERFRTAAIFKKKDMSSHFIIQLIMQDDGAVGLFFIFNKRFRIFLKIKKEQIIIFDKDFDFHRIFAVTFKKFISLMTDWDSKNYSEEMQLGFIANEVLFKCKTSRFDNGDNLNSFYSEYLMRMQANIINSVTEYEDVLNLNE